jgi:hypothetical protein
MSLKQTNTNTMTINQAEKAGVKAFNDGRQAAPALHQTFLNAACKSATPTRDLLKAYIHGWAIANLAKDAPTPTMPSVKEFERIMTA